MVRISKQQERRNKCPKRCRPPSPKTGPLKDALPAGYKQHTNAIVGERSAMAFIPKIKSK